MDVLARGVGRGVHMGDEGEDRCAGTGGGQCADDIPGGVHCHVLQAQSLHLVDQQMAQRFLPRCAGRFQAGVVRGRPVGDVGEKAVQYVHSSSFCVPQVARTWQT